MSKLMLGHAKYMSKFIAYSMALFGWTSLLTLCDQRVTSGYEHVRVLNVIEDATGNYCTSLLCGTKTGETWCVDILFVGKFVGHVQNRVT